MAKPKPDPNQLNMDKLFEAPERPPVNVVGSLDYSAEVRECLASMLRADRRDRFTVAAELSRLTGKEITAHMLNAWTADSKEGHRFPLEFLPALCVVLRNTELLDVIAKKCGCLALKGDEVVEANLGRVQKKIDQLNAEKKRLQLQARQAVMGGAA